MLHKHQCGDCGHIFEHEVPDTRGMAPAKATRFYDDGHMCPLCNTGPWKERYFANAAEKLQFTRDLLIEEGMPAELAETITILRELVKRPMPPNLRRKLLQ